MMDHKQKHLLMQVNEAGFALDDVVLFLDTHPDCQQALAYYHKVRDMKKALMQEYAELYGPLTKDQVRPDAKCFTWVDAPWPWEGGMC